ncbi:MAG: glycoside hydrolase family 172 protein [Armatimonadota bacterium]
MVRRLYLVTLLIAISCSARAGTTLTYVDLVKRLTDLEALAVLPQPGETCAQWSSYDRASTYDAASGKYVNWDANGDGHGIIRKEGNLQVFAEMEGPGCIWRIWSAAPKDGRVMIYLDGSDVPAVDLPFESYFDRKNRPFTQPSLVHYTSSGANCYVPIPYQKSCKIVAENGWGSYYHFTYETFPKDTVVPTFSRSLSAEELKALDAADKLLTDGLGSDPAGPREGEATISKRFVVPAGGSVTAARIRGPRAITAIKARFEPKWAEKAWARLREVVLKITWDDEPSPSVWCPLGDFFGTAPGINEYKSLPLGMTQDGGYCFWYMPFAKSAVVELVNDGADPAPIELSITHAPVKDNITDMGRFHAKWHRDAFLPSEPERWIDWPMLKTTGRGRYCGVMLHVWNPKGGWWGEGDEKFFVDGEKFPSTFGTGSEDYFGYAWCNPQLFQNAYHNQTFNQRSNAGNVSVNRWHIADNVPFQTSFEADIEKYYPNDRPTLYAAVAYWYQAAGQYDPYGPVPVTERVGYYEGQTFSVPGAIEVEQMKVLACSAGKIQVQELAGFDGLWSNLAHLWWTEAGPSARMDLQLRTDKPGKYEIKAQLTKAPDYAIVQLYLDDEKLGDPIDLYSDGVAPTGELSLGTRDLSRGPHKLTVEIIGANEKAVKAYMFGLDYVRLNPVADS